MRAFVAINLPDAERVRLHTSLAPLRALSLPVRWLPPESLHLTLEFLGEIDAPRAARVEAVLGEVAAGTRAFDIEAGGVGAFPNLTRPRVWWVGVREHESLMRTQAALESALAAAGHTREARRPFSPHITIGRTKAIPRRPQPATTNAVKKIRYDAQIHVTSLDLMESRLSADGACYTRRLAARLATTPRHGGTGAESIPTADGGVDVRGRLGESYARVAARESLRFE